MTAAKVTIQRKTAMMKLPPSSKPKINTLVMMRAVQILTLFPKEWTWRLRLKNILVRAHI